MKTLLQTYKKEICSTKKVGHNEMHQILFFLIAPILQIKMLIYILYSIKNSITKPLYLTILMFFALLNNKTFAINTDFDQLFEQINSTYLSSDYIAYDIVTNYTDSAGFIFKTDTLNMRLLGADYFAKIGHISYLCYGNIFIFIDNNRKTIQIEDTINVRKNDFNVTYAARLVKLADKVTQSFRNNNYYKFTIDHPQYTELEVWMQKEKMERMRYKITSEGEISYIEMKYLNVDFRPINDIGNILNTFISWDENQKPVLVAPYNNYTITNP